MYCTFVFTDFIPDAVVKYQLGYVFCGIILIHLIYNILTLISVDFRSLKIRIKTHIAL